MVKVIKSFEHIESFDEDYEITKVIVLDKGLTIKHCKFIWHDNMVPQIWSELWRGNEKLVEMRAVTGGVYLEVLGTEPESRGHKKKLYSRLRKMLGITKQEFSEIMGIVGGWLSKYPLIHV